MWKPEDAVFRPEPCPDPELIGAPLGRSKWAYLDRVSENMLVGRFRAGNCPKGGEHAYIATMTKRGGECACLYCGTTMRAPEAKFSEWDGEPRRATEEERRSVGAELESHKMTYCDLVDNSVCTGRFRLGVCPKGGEHECVLWF